MFDTVSRQLDNPRSGSPRKEPHQHEKKQANEPMFAQDLEPDTVRIAGARIRSPSLESALLKSLEAPADQGVVQSQVIGKLPRVYSALCRAIVLVRLDRTHLLVPRVGHEKEDCWRQQDQ